MLQRYAFYLIYPNIMADIFGYQTSFNYAYLCINSCLLIVLELVRDNAIADITLLKENLVTLGNHQVDFRHQI